MTRILPKLDELALRNLKSKAEATVYRKCADFGSDYVVLFSVPWIHVTSYGKPRDGETDFIVFHPLKGILVIEVKGGGIVHDPTTETWTSRDVFGEAHTIKNPFRQSKDSKYALIEYLNQNDEWSHLSLRPIFGHAVLLPDISNAKVLTGPDRPPEIVGTKSDVNRLSDWIDSVFQYWSGQPENKSISHLGKTGMDYVARHFCKTVEVRPLLSTILHDEEQARIKLTREQGLVIAALKQQQRAAIAGGAGTGKTVLALNKSIELAKEGLKTLLICYNEPLADLLNRTTENIDNLNAMSFHQLCRWFVDVAETNTGTNYMQRTREENPGADDYDFCLHIHR